GRGLPWALDGRHGFETCHPLEQTRRGVTTQDLPGCGLLLEQHRYGDDVPHHRGKLRIVRRTAHHRHAWMQAYAKAPGRSAHCLKALLVHLKTPLQFERDTHGTPSVILMSGRHPKHDEQVV